MDTSAELVTKLLHDLKAQNGWTETQLAAHLGVSTDTLARWRKGKIGKVARALLPLAEMHRSFAVQKC